MDFIIELGKHDMNIMECSKKSGIPYATLYPIIKGQVDIGTCSYYTVEKLARTLGYRPDQIVYRKEDFQTFRNNLHHNLKRNDIQVVLNIIEDEEIEYYRLHQDYIKMLYLVAMVDYISKKHDIPLCDKYNELRRMKLKEPYYVGDSAIFKANNGHVLEEFAKYNIMEGDLYDAV